MKHIITFIKEDGSMYSLKCTRTYKSCEKLALKHYLNNKCIAYVIN